MNIIQYLRKRQAIISLELENILSVAGAKPKPLRNAVRYALKGGKKIRPILCLACAEAVGVNAKAALKPACAIEMVHAYSLIHDDLPCMDNDDYRRGRLTVHKKFGVANAVLAGDALLTEAFSVLASGTPDNNINIELIRILASAAGMSGMIAGQAADIETEVKDIAMQEYINIHKTGALIAASCKMGAVAGLANPNDAQVFFKFGGYLGLVFQITDDIMDSEGSSGIIGRKKAFEYARELTETAKSTIKHFQKSKTTLYRIADFILNRKN